MNLLPSKQLWEGVKKIDILGDMSPKCRPPPPKKLYIFQTSKVFFFALP